MLDEGFGTEAPRLSSASVWRQHSNVVSLLATYRK